MLIGVLKDWTPALGPLTIWSFVVVTRLPAQYRRRTEPLPSTTSIERCNETRAAAMRNLASPVLWSAICWTDGALNPQRTACALSDCSPKSCMRMPITHSVILIWACFVGCRDD